MEGWHTHTHSACANTHVYRKLARAPSQAHVPPHAHGSNKMDRQSASLIFLPLFPNKPVSLATILIVTERRHEREDGWRERDADMAEGGEDSPRRE